LTLGIHLFLDSIRLVLLSCHVDRHKEISLGIPESGPIRACRSRMLRERRKRSPAKGMSFSDLNNKPEIEKKRYYGNRQRHSRCGICGRLHRNGARSENYLGSSRGSQSILISSPQPGHPLASALWNRSRPECLSHCCPNQQKERRKWNL
jgi:hypothetical protein